MRRAFQIDNDSVVTRLRKRIGSGSWPLFITYFINYNQMKELIQSATFRKWFSNIRDKRTRTAIISRLFRLAAGLPGDVAAVGEGISELRIHYGPGYRIYYRQQKNEIILIACGGTKRSQLHDIAMAKILIKTWEEQEDEWNIYDL